MAIVNRYRLWCNDESAWVYAWAEETPGSCPNNTTHSLDASKTSIISKAGAEQPTKEDGTPLVALNPAGIGSALIMKGFAATIDKDSSPNPTLIDTSFAEKRHLGGASGEIWGDFVPGDDGDFVEFVVVHPVAGEVAKFGETMYLRKSGLLGPFVSELTTSLVAGLIIRVK